MTTLTEVGPRRPRGEPYPPKDGPRRHCCPPACRDTKAADLVVEDADPVILHADPARAQVDPAVGAMGATVTETSRESTRERRGEERRVLVPCRRLPCGCAGLRRSLQRQ
jgi:hypothetical protein